MTDTTWEPGDPLHRPGSYTNYVFNWRDDPEIDQPGPDAASWPEPRGRYTLPADDELSVFIEAHHRWAAHEGDVA